MVQSKRPIIIGITGGSGSRETTIAREVYDQLQQDDHTLIMMQDSYYKNDDDLSMSECKKINYDHPDAFNIPLPVKQLRQLMGYKTIKMPVYDFTAHTRGEKTVHTEPANIIILEGVLVFGEENLRNLMSIKVFADTDDDIRFIRRLECDTQERGRSVHSVIDQYSKTVKPIYNQFIKPTERYADIIAPEGGENDVTIDMLTTKTRSVLSSAK